jgi:hypothetical protein
VLFLSFTMCFTCALLRHLLRVQRRGFLFKLLYVRVSVLCFTLCITCALLRHLLLYLRVGVVCT